MKKINSYELNSIGKMIKQEEQMELSLEKKYWKGLKFLQLFSHVLIFYTEDGRANFLKETVGEVICVNEKQGTMSLKIFDEKVETGIVFDIKPYFPCEDRVKESYENHNTENQSNGTSLEIDSEDTKKYKLKELGKIRKIRNGNFIELEADNILERIKGYSHIKILWWFHRFDNQKLRTCVECNPPYEDAPRTGVFATRSAVRPNPIAISTAKILKIDEDKKRIYVNHTECFDETPCIDILPYEKDKDYVEQVNVPEWLMHWPQWLDDRTSSIISGNISYQSSPLETQINAWRSKEEQNFDKDIWNQEDRTVENKSIIVKGARQNNLKGIDCVIPYHKITAVVGVSGSGKSSLVYDTIYAECKRRMAIISDNQKDIKRPNVDQIMGIIPAIAISQKDIGRNSRSTVGTYSDVYDYLRTIFATVGVRHCPECGEAIVPMTTEEIIDMLENKKNVSIFDLENKEICANTIAEKVKQALKTSKGALWATIGDNEPILLQTTQMCYSCNRLLFELTPATFNYSDVESMCPVCNGYGEKSEVDVKRIVEKPELSILEGASSWWGKLRAFQKNPNANWMKGEIIGLALKMGVDLEQSWCDLPEDFRHKAIYGSEKETVTFQYDNKKNGRNGTICRTVEGAYHCIERFHTEKSNLDVTEKYMKKVKCDHCNGERLQAEGRLVSIGEYRFPEVSQMTLKEIGSWCKMLPAILGKTWFLMTKSSIQRLYDITVKAGQLGIDYLELDRNTATLSGGEQQRLKLLESVGNCISGMLYVLDEPSKGLHPKDYENVAKIIYQIRDSGNTVLMVEHNEDMIKIADNIIEIGPSAGEQGGYLVGEGNLKAMLNHKETQISKYMNAHSNTLWYHKRDTEHLTKVIVHGANFNNLKNIDVSFPVHAITCVCGVSGCGKSSLVNHVIYENITKIIDGNKEMEYCQSIENGNYFKKVIVVDQASIGRTSRSVPATYMGIMDRIRKKFAETALAKQNKMDANSFSFNNKVGQCDNCHGDGQIMPKFSDDIWITCPVCKGKRYKKAILEMKYKNKSIAEVLDMSVEQAKAFFHDIEEIQVVLKTLEEVGLGYLKLGQNSTTLSGGEASRLKLAKELTAKNIGSTLYLIDEPTTGLHFSDTANLICLFQKLVEEGNTIVIIEHNKHMMDNCDWMIELGPKAGKEGGYVIREGKE